MSIASIYLMTTVVRMFLLGTLVPLVSLDSAARDIFQSLVGVIDLFGLYYAINQTVGKPVIKVFFLKLQKIFKKKNQDSFRLGRLGAGRECTVDSVGVLEWCPAVRVLVGVLQLVSRAKH